MVSEAFFPFEDFVSGIGLYLERMVVYGVHPPFGGALISELRKCVAICVTQ